MLSDVLQAFQLGASPTPLYFYSHRCWLAGRLAVVVVVWVYVMC